jgi:hypothetical protein
MRKSLLAFFFLCFFFVFRFEPIHAQAINDFNSYKDKYPKAEVICTKMHQVLEIKLEDNHPKITYKTLEEFFYLGENNSGYSNRSISYSGFYDLKEYKAFLYSVQNDKYKKYEVKDFKVNDFQDDNIFFDDSHELKFMFPQIGKGNKTVIENTYHIKDPHFLPKLYLSPYLNYEDVKYTLIVQDGFEIAIDSFLHQENKLNFSLVKKAGTSIYSWTGSSPKSLDYEGNGPDMGYVANQFFFRIKTYEVKGNKVPVLSNLTDLYHWNCAFLTKTKEDITQFKSLSDSIVGKETNEEKKAELIFNWVQNNIRYIAMEAGYDGFIPAQASSVCKERYGDCKGIANILYSLLRSQNLEAYMVWIGTRSIPYKYTELPSPVVDNHMITALRLNGKTLFLDGTSHNLKFGLPSPFIQGKEAMVSSNNCEDFTIELVPEVSFTQNTIEDSCYITMDKKSLIGSGLAVFNGYKRLSFVDQLSNREYRHIQEQCRYYLLRGNNRFILDTVWLENLDNNNLPLLVHYKFNIPDYAIFVDNEYYLNLNLDKPSIPSKVDLTRNVGMEYRFMASETNNYYFEIPKGYQVLSLPSKIEKNTTVMNFSNEYILTKNGILRKQSYAFKTLLLEPKDFPIYNSTVEAMQKNYSDQITLKLK